MNRNAFTFYFRNALVLGFVSGASGLWSPIIAQQVPQYVLSPFSLAEINPSTVGLDGTLAFTSGLRRQWNKLPGQPEGFHASLQMALPFISSGAGLTIMQDQVGLFKHTEVTASYSFHYPVSRQGILAGGIGVGIMQTGLDGTGIRTPQGEYPSDSGSDHKDGVLPVGQANGLREVVHAGVSLKYNRFLGGISLRNVTAGSIRLSNQNESVNIANKPHALLHASYNIGDGLLVWQPVIQLRTEGVAWQFDGMVYATWKDRFMLGGGLRGGIWDQGDAWMVGAGLRINERLLLMYAFEQGISTLRSAHQGSFELLLRYDLEVRTGSGILPPRIYNPRFL